jgi:hypothetical protein
LKKITIWIIFLGYSISLAAQQSIDQQAVSSIKAHIGFLASDKLEGRRIGTKGEELAYQYIISQLKLAGINTAPGIQDYLQPFEVYDGRKLEDASLKFNGKLLKAPDEFFPLAYAGDARKLVLNSGSKNDCFVYDLEQQVNLNKDNPHFDLKATVRTAAEEAQQKGYKLVLVIGHSKSAAELGYFDKSDRSKRLQVPVIFMLDSVYKAEKNGNFKYKLSYTITESSRKGHNVVGYLNNESKRTVVIGAHYDHLGYGEDHNSLYAGSTPMIHNGADDNASGTAALIELSKVLKTLGDKDFNFLFVAFSGEELGLFGSKYFVEHCPIPLSDIDYMINMDMVGRLNDSTHAITIGGYGTSPAWGKLIQPNNSYLRIKTDSAGSGPSDHTSFYRKEIPVLFFFTGTHSDYHKPTDDAEKVNAAGEWRIIQYIVSLINQTATYGKLEFTKTREAAASGKSSFKVTMGIMPDYTFSGQGVLVDGVSDGRPAKKVGIMAGDVILQLGEHKVSDVQTYMQALNKFNKGEKTTVTFKRGNKEMKVDLEF